MAICKIFFFIFLVIAAWQDYQTKEIDGCIFEIAGVAGVIVCIIGCVTEQREWSDVAVSCGVGAGLLLLRRLSNGGIGDGDGWFFVVSGLYLSGLENIGLLLSGLGMCFLWSLPLMVKAILENGKGRNRQLPFLPFLLPAGVWLVIT